MDGKGREDVAMPFNIYADLERALRLNTTTASSWSAVDAHARNTLSSISI
jgi:hypothetical protein